MQFEMLALSSRKLGIVLALSGVLGIVILLTDQTLRGATDHFYALILFVIVDSTLSGLVIAEPKRNEFRLAAIWCASRIILQLGDITQAPTYHFSYTQFADYLFNPVSSISSSLGNPPGVPGTILDIIIILELMVVTSVMRSERVLRIRRGDT